jgi:hypothetical protein
MNNWIRKIEAEIQERLQTRAEDMMEGQRLKLDTQIES